MLPSVYVCHRARLARDPRFDGQFFTGVKTTGIYCRPICPAMPPKEENVQYFSQAIAAARAGFRPCLRCRPDSAPGSAPWKGVNTSLDRAIGLIDKGALQQGSIVELAGRLGMSDRHLRQIFQQHLGISPKEYALYQQCLFAKQLLHQTRLSITHIALASGFSSIRRFNDCFQKQLNLSPSKVRQSLAHKAVDSSLSIKAKGLKLKLYYRPPYDWSFVQGFLMRRAVSAMEWGNEHSYGRTFQWLKSQGTKIQEPGTQREMIEGQFTAHHIKVDHRFDVRIELNDLSQLKPIVNNIRRILDVDLDMQAVEQDLHQGLAGALPITTGLRLPGIWNLFEAGVRAILGQQISVAAAHTLLTTLVTHLGQPVQETRLFPTPAAIADSELEFLKIPGSRKQTLRNLARHYLDHDNPEDPDSWLPLKGIGPWTVNYAKLRGMSHPDIFLGGDLGVQKALKKYVNGLNFQSENCLKPEIVIDPEAAAPWRSYLTLQLWSRLA